MAVIGHMAPPDRRGMRERGPGSHGSRRPTSLRAAAFLWILIAALPACDDDDILLPDARVDATGSWSGETGDGWEVRLILAEDRGDDLDRRRRAGVVEGAGTIVRSDTSIAVVVEGTNVSGSGDTNLTPDLTLTLRADEPSDGSIRINYQARFVGTDRLEGRLNGGGFVDEPLTLRKQVDFDLEA